MPESDALSHSLTSTQTPNTGLRHPSFKEVGAGKRCSECDQYPTFSEDADSVGGQLRGHKKCPFSGVTISGGVWRKVPESDALSHTPSIAFRHLPPNSARFSYATEGALFISAQKSSDAVSALRKVRVLI